MRLSLLVVEQGLDLHRGGEDVLWPALAARANGENRYRKEGADGMADRNSRPHHSPTKTPQSVLKQMVRLRWRRRLGAVQIAGRLSMATSTVHAVLTRCRINRLSRIDRATGEPLRRCEHDRRVR